MKRICCAILLLCVLLSLAVPARAVDSEQLAEDMSRSIRDGVEVNLRSYKLTVEELDERFNEFYYKGQLPWYTQGDYTYTYNEQGIVQEFEASRFDELLHDRNLYERYLAELLDEACLPGMSDWQKVLSVHDYIVLHTVYDESYLHNTGYDALVNGTTVCSGYSELFMAAMQRLGIHCQMAMTPDTGDGEGHSWNVVQLDGKWYHLDLTWDDPTHDTYGKAEHVYFLKTDLEFWMGEEDWEAHDFVWTCYVDITDASYTEDDFLNDVTGTVCFVDENHAAFRRDGDYTADVISRDLTSGEETVLYHFDKKVINLGEGEYLYPTCGLNYWNGRIYFNREDEILSMLPDGSDLQQVYTREVDSQYIYGAMVDDGVLYMTLCDSQLERSPVQVTLEGMEFHTHTYEQFTKEPTCLAEGFRGWYCECGFWYTEMQLPQLEHQLISTVEQEATLKEGGVIRYHCTDCDYETYEYTSKKLNLDLDDASDMGALAARVVVAFLIIRFFIRLIRKGRKR